MAERLHQQAGPNARIWFSIVTEKDAIALCKWWNGFSSQKFYHTYQQSSANPRFFDVMRTEIVTSADRDKWWFLPHWTQEQGDRDYEAGKKEMRMR